MDYHIVSINITLSIINKTHRKEVVIYSLSFPIFTSILYSLISFILSE